MKDACKYLRHHCKCNAIFRFLFQDLIIFPDDIEYKRVKQCTTGRVYILKFKSSTRKFFFWMQEPKTDKDEEYMTKVNNLLNNPPTPGSGGGGSGLPPALAGLTEQLGKFDDQAYGECHILITCHGLNMPHYLIQDIGNSLRKPVHHKCLGNHNNMITRKDIFEFSFLITIMSHLHGNQLLVQKKYCRR